MYGKKYPQPHIAAQFDNIRQNMKDKSSLWYKEMVYNKYAFSQNFLGVKQTTDHHLGAVSIRKTVLPGMAIPMLKIRRPNGRLIFNMEIAIRR